MSDNIPSMRAATYTNQSAIEHTGAAARMDVLVVMDELLATYHVSRGAALFPRRARVEEARAAVAELIAAVDAVYAILEKPRDSNEELDKAEARLRAARARIGGAA